MNSFLGITFCVDYYYFAVAKGQQTQKKEFILTPGLQACSPYGQKGTIQVTVAEKASKMLWQQEGNDADKWEKAYLHQTVAHGNLSLWAEFQA